MSIRQFGDALLRRRAQPVRRDQFSQLDATIAIMRAQLYEQSGVGIAANQCAQIENPHQIIIVGNDDLRSRTVAQTRYPDRVIPSETVMINPVILEVHGDVYYPGEGCLSIRGSMRGRACRYPKVVVRYFDVKGKPRVETHEGMAAHIVQHECEHLYGVMFIQKIFSELTRQQLISLRERINKAIETAKEDADIIPALVFDRDTADQVAINDEILRHELSRMDRNTLSHLANELSNLINYRRAVIDLRALPLAELHVHIEGGTLDEETVRLLAKRNDMTIRESLFNGRGGIAFKEKDFIDFLSAYDEATSFVLTEQDVFEVIYRYLKRCHEQGAIYLEVTCSSDHLRQHRKHYLAKTDSRDIEERVREVGYNEFVNAVARAIDQARDDFGIETRILMVLLRHNGARACDETLQEIIDNPHPYVVGINLAGDEVNFPASDFAALYEKARRHGLKTTAHVGEHVGPEVMWTAIEALRPQRIGHGVHAIIDPKLVEYLKQHEIGVEVCPGSNIALGVYENLDQHPFKKLFDAGLYVSLNSDDPTYFDTSIGAEYKMAQQQWGLSRQDLEAITRNAITTSFAQPMLKQALLARVDLFSAYQDLCEIFVNHDEWQSQPSLQQLIEQYGADAQMSGVEELRAFTDALDDTWHDVKCGINQLHLCQDRFDIAARQSMTE